MIELIKKLRQFSWAFLFLYGITISGHAQIITKSESQTTGSVGNAVTYVMSITNNSPGPVTCSDNFDSDTPGNFPNGWTGPIGGCAAPDAVEAFGGAHNNVFEITSTAADYGACYSTFNCPGQVTDGSICADLNVASGRAELLWRQNGASTYQVSLGPAAADGTDSEIRVITNGGYVVLAAANMGYAINTWYNVCMVVNGFNIQMYVNGALIISATDPNSTFASGNVGLESSTGPASAEFDNVVVTTTATNYLNTTVTDTLPANLTYVSCSGAGGACSDSGGVVNWNVGTVNASTSKSVTLVANITGSCPESIVNQASWNIGLPQTIVTSNAVTDIISCIPTPTNTATMTSTFTHTPTMTNTPTATFTRTFTPTMTNTVTNTPTNTYTATPTSTYTFTNTATKTFTNTFTSTFTNTSTYTPTKTFTNTATNTNTFTNTVTSTYSNTPTKTSTATFTATFTNTFSATPTPTSTNTLMSTATSTNTFTNTATNTYSSTLTKTPTATFTASFTNTFTTTSTPTSTNTLMNTATNTYSSTPTKTPTTTFTASFTNTFSTTPTPTSTNTLINTATNTNTPTLTATSTHTATNTVTLTNSETPTNTLTATNTNTLENTATNSTTPTATYTSTETNTSTNTYTYPNTHTPTNTMTKTTTQTSTTTFTITPTETLTHTPTITLTPNRTPSPISTSTLMPTWTPTATPPPDNFWVCRNLFNVTINGTVCITVSAGETGETSLKIYNSAGEHIKTLYDKSLNEPLPSTTFYWDGTNKFGNKVVSSVYIIYYTTPIKRYVARLVVLH